MIISASYKTDIPAFYGEWFINRLQAGFCMMRNPLNRKPIRVSLAPADVDGIVFWTKNLRPFAKRLAEVRRLGFPFIVQYTINGYPRSLETNVVEWRKSAETVREVATEFGRRRVVWRYDTIIFTDETPANFHVENFQRIAQSLEGYTDEVVISFMQVYQKTKSNMNRMSLETSNHWYDPATDEKVLLAETLTHLAETHGMTLTICTQPELLTTQKPARCIDAQRLSDITGRAVCAKTHGNRPGCECAKSRDIGDYDTCPHGCIYCYAVRNQSLAVARFKGHDPQSHFLFDDQEAPAMMENSEQLTLDYSDLGT